MSTGWAGLAIVVPLMPCTKAAFWFVGVPILIVIAGAVLEVALLTHDFSLGYVTEHTDMSTPTALVAAGFYGGQEGSLLYWALILGVLGSASLVASAAAGLDAAETSPARA